MPAAASKPGLSQHALEVGGPGNGAILATSVPALPVPRSLQQYSLQPTGSTPCPEADKAGSEEAGAEKDVILVSVEILLLRTAAANAAVQLGECVTGACACMMQADAEAV